jgi:hypothetical protein
MYKGNSIHIKSFLLTAYEFKSNQFTSIVDELITETNLAYFDFIFMI